MTRRWIGLIDDNENQSLGMLLGIDLVTSQFNDVFVAFHRWSARRSQQVRCSQGVKLGTQARACSNQITRSVSVMERMISDLLDYTRTRLGTGMPVNPAQLDLAALAGELIAEFRAARPDREVNLHTDGELNDMWDSDRVRQAMSNLIGNAFQHGSADFPVTLSLGGDASNVVIDIHNGGDTIPPGELPKIFDPLIRGSSAERPKSNRPGSIGMGLYIAREVAKSHGGRIDVTSTVEHGTSFTIRLPRQATPRVGQPIHDAEHVERCEPTYRD
ncbi:MAG: HAMP domain-containing sensor histidine kinase [Planctomycetaceae bacterium]